ncbi:MAG: LysR family transcriptional regulator [Gracilibacteraceae bacterium]|jgi:DNA-binding transcriptional LysR family regulator|nr:LysR family transcriptional regulator [Gracilibacteraceae bacterium]
MDFKQLYYFAQICNYRSLTKTAKNLYVTQQALSKNLKSLESELQVSLFARMHDGVSLTAEGEYLRSRAEKILSDFKAFETDVYDYFHVKRGLVSFAITNGALHSLSPEILLDFQGGYPNIRLWYQSYPDQLAEQRVLEGKVEFACMERPQDLTHLAITTVKEEKIVISARGDHALVNKPKVRIADLRDQQIITHSKDTYLYHIIVNSCRQAGFEPQIIFNSSDVSLLKKLLLRGRGIFVTAEHTLSDITLYPEIRATPVEDPNLRWHVCFVYPRSKKLGCVARLFMNYILTAYGRASLDT